MSGPSQGWNAWSAARKSWTVIGAILAFLLLLAALGVGEEDNGDRGPSNEAGLSGRDGDTQTERSQTAPQDADRGMSVDDARAAVDDDDYARALQTAAAIGSEEPVRRAISDRIAERVIAAVFGGNRGGAGRLLRTADREGYPATADLTEARGDLRAATLRAGITRRQQRERTLGEAQQSAERADPTEPEPESDAGAGCEPGYDPCVPAFPPDLDCADVGGSISVTGNDPHGLDRDRDGIGCE